MRIHKQKVTFDWHSITVQHDKAEKGLREDDTLPKIILSHVTNSLSLWIFKSNQLIKNV